MASSNFPGSLDDSTTVGSDAVPAAGDDLNDTIPHSDRHQYLADAVVQVETKVGTGASTPTSGAVLMGTGSGTSGWNTSPDITGTLDVTGAVTFDSTLAVTGEITATGGVAGNVTGDLTGNSDTATTATTAATATVAEKVTIANEAVDTNAPVLFVKESGDGNKTVHSNGSIRVDSAAATLHATGFVGDLTGDVTGDVTGNVTGNVTGDVTGDVTGNVSGGTLIEADTLEIDTDGSATAPSLRFNSDTDVGMFRPGTDEIALTAGGEVQFIGTESTNNNAGFAGDGHVGIGPYSGGFTGTMAVITTTTISGETVKRLGFSSSARAGKANDRPFSLSDDQYRQLAPTSFERVDHYVEDGKHYVVGTDAPERDAKGRPVGKSPRAQIPGGALPLRRAGLILEDTAEVDLHLVTEHGIDYEAVNAATIGKVIELLDRVDALEAEVAALKEGSP
jgi:hypothetical protein